MAENQQQADNDESKALAASVPPTSGGSPLHKRNSDENGETDSSNKRPKVVVDDTTNDTRTTAASSETKTVVTPTSTSTTPAKQQDASSKAAAAAAASAKAASPPETTTETLDLAETLGLKAGAEIEVQWEIHNDAKDAKASAASDSATTTTTTTAAAASSDAPSVSLHWWKAKLLEHDGRTTDSVAIRTLLYEPRPDLGFPKESREDVVFLGKDVLVTSTNSNAEHWDSDPESVNQMPYRRLDRNDEVFFYNDDQLEEQLNQLLMGAFHKNQAAWNSMPAAQQALIAETIQKKKTQLASILRAEAKQNNNKVITPEAIKEILARTF